MLLLYGKYNQYINLSIFSYYLVVKYFLNTFVVSVNNMSLDSILKPAIWLDRQVLTQHTRVAEFIEERTDINKNTLAYGLSIVSLAIGCADGISGILGLYPTPEFTDKVYNTIMKTSHIFVSNGIPLLFK